MAVADSNGLEAVPPPVRSVSSLSDAEITRALEAGNALSPWFRTEEQVNTDLEHLPRDHTAWVAQVSGPAIGCFDVRRSGSLVEVDHYPSIDGHLCGEISSVGLFDSIETAFSGIAAWLREALTPEFVAA